MDRKRALKKWYVSIKKNSICRNCGEKRWYVLTFHHNGDDKKYKVSSLNNFESIEKLKEEISKCEVLCSNCHMELHFLENVVDKN